MGDFDGSGRSDLLCRQNGSIEIFYNLLKRQKQPLDFCQNKNSQLTAADFNGDKKQDLLCRAKDGKMKVLLADETGKFKGVKIYLFIYIYVLKKYVYTRKIHGSPILIIWVLRFSPVVMSRYFVNSCSPVSMKV